MNLCFFIVPLFIIFLFGPSIVGNRIRRSYAGNYEQIVNAYNVHHGNGGNYRQQGALFNQISSNGPSAVENYRNPAASLPHYHGILRSPTVQSPAPSLLLAQGSPLMSPAAPTPLVGGQLSPEAVAALRAAALALIQQTAQSPIVPAPPSGTVPESRMYNWAGTFQFSTQNIHWPRSVAQVQQMVKNADKIRCIGQRHSFSTIGDSNWTLLATIGLKNIVNPLAPLPPLGPFVGIDPRDPTVWVQAGLTYTDLAPFLDFAGYALSNLAGLGELSIGGAAQTGAHGSGNTLGALATQIRALRVVRADGAEVLIRRGDPRLDALATGLGAFGVVTTLELGLVRRFNVITSVFVNLPHQQFLYNFDAIMSAGYTVQVFSDFLLPGVWNQVWVTERTDQPNNQLNKQTFLLNTGARRATQQTSPMAFLLPSYLTKQGIEQTWYQGLVDYQLGVLAPADYRNSISGVSSGGDEIQTEYFVAYANARKAIEVVYRFSPLLAPLLWYACIRTVRCDQLWLSPTRCRGPGDQLALANDLTFKPDFALINPVLRQVEQALVPLGVRPHWGKHFLMEPREFMHTYDRHAEFVALAQQFDPKGKFRNDFLDKFVFAADIDNNRGK